ncbi:hypothetical protein KHC23_09185 [Ancylobacter dichloromethanicus]|uniref:Uncharacterized protein n=1 Tax=Ancylobacter dichloromethanicus TaxID=518825 RepID=A0A9W6MYG6_9HYPH|nr:hypothetical protein [Ancylobacter dichloromethanicus]MBS7553825.1 hypothetical protein [Ancylobacter dichloromethanicus]GLK70930.1 hypothetical protein GCM10017643_10450 [Ancylobacter dichloromethanicus]
MVRDPRKLDQNPVVVDPANVDAVLDDRTTSVTSPLRPPLDEVDNDNHPVDGKPTARDGGRFAPDTFRTVDGSPDGTPKKPDDPRR